MFSFTEEHVSDIIALKKLFPLLSLLRSKEKADLSIKKEMNEGS